VAIPRTARPVTSSSSRGVPTLAENDALREAAAIGWDACVAALRHEDGTPVEVVTMVNPYRAAPPLLATRGVSGDD
jgi:hypothetical protein